MARRVKCKDCKREFDIGTRIPSKSGIAAVETCPHCGATHRYTAGDYRMPRHTFRRDRAIRRDRDARRRPSAD